MRRNIQGIDHVVVLVKDLDKASSAYARMGFSLTPRGFHTLGSQNHCIMFGSDYIELLAVPKPHPAMQYFTDFLADGEGLGAIALSTSDATAARAELAASGVNADEPLDFSRPVEKLGDAKFRIVQLPPELSPGCRMFLCQHFTRELVWTPGSAAHALGVTQIAGVAVIAPDAQGYESLLGEASQPVDEGRSVNTGSAPITVGNEDQLKRKFGPADLPTRRRPVIAALSLRVADRARAADALRKGGFAPAILKDGSLAIGAGEAHGVALIFS
jgi:catechol 2,3-dioxygenase-like lactoylglutathione lyase family enzyme